MEDTPHSLSEKGDHHSLQSRSMVSNLLYMHVNQDIPITLNNLFNLFFFFFKLQGYCCLSMARGLAKEPFKKKILFKP